MKLVAVVVAFVCAVLVLAGGAQATLIQEDFEGYPVGPGVPPGWFEGYHGPGATWQIIDAGGNHVLQGASGPAIGGGDASAGPNNGTAWFVENFEMQASLLVVTGSGGGIGVGQFDGVSYTGNSYYVEISVPLSAVALCEEGLSAGTDVLAEVYFPAGTINYGAWYDVRFVSTGTTFQVWFRPHSTQPWQEGERIIEVPHDLLHPGHKSYVEGLGGCWAQNNPGPSTMLFDNFYLEAMPFPAPEDFSDDFEDSTFSLANWSQHWCALDFPIVDGSQVGRVATTWRAAGIGLGQAKQYYTHNFVLRTSMRLDDVFFGGVAWGWEGTETGDTDFHIEIRRVGGNITLDFDEEQNSTGGEDETQLAWYQEPEQPGVYWYTIEVAADYKWYRVWWWKRGDAKPVSPVIAIPQDQAHPGYRLINLGAVALWQNPNRVGCFDDFYFWGTPAPQVNTPEGSSVQVEPEPGLSMTFDTVTEGGTTTVETSDLAPGGGPGGLEFLGTYYDINTTCVYSGPVTIQLTYDDTGMTPEQEANLRLMHWKTADQMWVDITTSVDPVNNVVTGVTDTLSVFALAVTPVFDGFLQPINMPPAAMSVFKRKSTIPVKFRLLNAATGAPVPDVAATIWIERVAAGVPSGVNEPVYSTQPDGGNTFRYDPTAGQYIFNLSARNMNTGTYRIHANIMGGLLQPWVDIGIR